MKPYEKAALVKPTERQLNWQKMEFYALISYGLPPFTGKQYGDGFAPATMFWPEDLNVEEWVLAAKSAGMKGLVLTCKHYDGFCLWPTAYTDYSLKYSNWKDGEGDIVKEVSDSCKKHGLKFGVYIAPWDRHEPSYGKGKEYDEFFMNLLRELLTNYGDIFCVWLDAVCGSAEQHVQDYDWAAYYALIRELQPDAAISFRGPDVRWIGNERGVTRESEWSVVPAHMGVREDGTSPAAKSKKSKGFMDLDIGSRKAIKNEEEFIWYPAECSVPIRDHWFHVADDKYGIKTKDKLLKLYYNTVGGNANLMLGLAPDKRGHLDETDLQVLSALGHDLKLYFGYNLAQRDGTVSASSEISAQFKAANCISDDEFLIWKPADNDKKPYVEIELNEADLFDKVVIMENIRNGQHIEEFEVTYLNEKGKWKKCAEGTVVGYKKICCLKPTKAKKVRITFISYRAPVEILQISLN
ncbi:MAG: alpha-fucosidase [Ruminococcaceae bacterium]|nr:alpha-fucosidase [Oscillospiraceae bacterium]